MKIKTKYNIGDIVKYFGEEFVDNGVLKCCKRYMKNLKIISKSFSSKLTQPNILNDSAPFEELHHYTKGLLK